MRSSIAVAALFVIGCDAPDRAPSPRPRGTYVVTAPDPEPDAIRLAAGEPLIFYLNRSGGTYSPGRNDARTNRSSLVDRASTVPPWDVTDDGWQQVVTCVRDQFARWNVVVTDVDPGNVPHLESVIAGDPLDIGQEQGVGGVSPFALDCSTIDNSIVFTFAEVFDRNYRVVCEVAAQEMAHSFGLDHERLCEDPMTYLDSCGRKSFQDRAAPCGEYEDRECACGELTQNSVAILTDRLGLAAATPDGGVPVDAAPGAPDARPGPGRPDAGSGASADPAGEIVGTCAASRGATGAWLVAVLAVALRRRRRS
jgi:hypothetical protein